MIPGARGPTSPILCQPRDGLGRSQAHGVEECQRGTAQETSYALTPDELRRGNDLFKSRVMAVRQGFEFAKACF
jgi:hypothetical protein